MPQLTIGLPTYDDFDGVYFTVQALRLYQDLDDAEVLVVDNFGCESTRQFIAGLPDVRYERLTVPTGTATAKNAVFHHACGDVVLCMDSHVLLAPQVVTRFKEYCRVNRPARDLLQGPLWLDDLHPHGVATHLSPIWSAGMQGQWATDQRGVDVDAQPFDIPSQGMGLFAHRRETWPGFNPLFRGFGGEEGYLQEKVRQQGGHVRCLPFLRWVHRFQRPRGTPYRVRTWDKCHNALIGHLELDLDPQPVVQHFAGLLPFDVLSQVVATVMQALEIDDHAALTGALDEVRDQALVAPPPTPSRVDDMLADEPPPRG